MLTLQLLLLLLLWQTRFLVEGVATLAHA